MHVILTQVGGRTSGRQKRWKLIFSRLPRSLTDDKPAVVLVL
jgi:hypothetical protein